MIVLFEAVYDGLGLVLIPLLHPRHLLLQLDVLLYFLVQPGLQPNVLLPQSLNLILSHLRCFVHRLPHPHLGLGPILSRLCE